MRLTNNKLPSFELALDEALQAPNAQHFMHSIRGGYTALYQDIVADPRRRKRGLDALDAFFAATSANMRRRRIAELCAWPIFDKPSLPVESGALPEFLWLFAMPFVVTFSVEQLSRPVLLEGEVFDANALLGCVEESGALNTDAYLRAFSTLLRRDDLHAYGPRGLASTFVQAELGSDDVPQPLPLLMDEEVESHRTVVYFVPCAARLAVGARHLMNPAMPWCDQAAAEVVRAGLEQQGLEVDMVRSLPPCSMSEALFHCSGSGLAELESNLAEARKLYGELQVLIKHPMDGFAEINAMNNEGQEIVLLPAFAFVEPQGELQQCVRAICEQHDITFKGAFSLPFASRLLH
jgi:hypothetical protein